MNNKLNYFNDIVNAIQGVNQQHNYRVISKKSLNEVFELYIKRYNPPNNPDEELEKIITLFEDDK